MGSLYQDDSYRVSHVFQSAQYGARGHSAILAAFRDGRLAVLSEMRFFYNQGSKQKAMHPLLNIAVRAARRAGDTIVRYLSRLDEIQVSTKGRNEYVTEVDRLAEQEIIRTIRKAYPDHGVLAEESGLDGPENYLWIIDPLDGTTNFLHGFPVFAVSIAFRHRGRLEQAVVYDPSRQELFTASQGAGAHLDGRRIRVSHQVTLEGSLLGTGFPYRANMQWADQYLEMLKHLSRLAAGVRRPGAAALDLAYVAAGRYDGFWELGLKPWDIAAGALLITEAGGRIADPLGGDTHVDSGHVVAGTPKVFEKLLQEIRPFLPDDLMNEAED